MSELKQMCIAMVVLISCITVACLILMYADRYM
ncbi:hypothetical protein 6939_0014 [Klebsiella phage 6939]|uniref:Uncharacterized protein n=1 Tax=Klebsiella phage 6939 TaxID=2912295 RepID=A0A9E7M7Q4_9CAUD|nr:hypothetical protein 6939_0014 [Klebsiella phage 6939]